MSQKFYKGRTNNHLTFVMVDATDFATPESALSAATKIMLHGKLRSSSLVHFVSSGTGSMAGGDIKHVGASATGVYTVALVKADLSDASAAWYDQYIATITGTGAAQQVLVIEGEIDASAFSDVLSNAYSAASVGSSRILLVQSRLSDLNSTLNSDISDIKSMLTAISGLVSDAHSAAVVAQSISASDMSDLRSAIAAGPAATITASDISDIASAVRATLVSDLSDILSAAQQTNSRVLLNLSRISDVASALTVVQSDTSDIASRITGAVATKSQVASATYALFASFISDVTSAFAANSNAVSDLHSVVTVTGVQLNASTLSDLRSAISAGAAGTLTVSDISDIASRVYTVLASDLSDLKSAVDVGNSRVLVVKSDVSDIKSAVTAGVPLDASTMSDLRSAVAAASLDASSISDIASAVKAALASDISDIYSLLSDLHSDVGVMSGIVSDINSAVTSVGFKKNTAITDFEFLMVASSDHITPKTGLTITATRSIDGAAFGACANSAAELSNGIYVIDLAAADLNGNIITFRFTGADADDRYVTIKTQP